MPIHKNWQVKPYPGGEFAPSSANALGFHHFMADEKKDKCTLRPLFTRIGWFKSYGSSNNCGTSYGNNYASTHKSRTGEVHFTT
jgi:hypothetical protein